MKVAILVNHFSPSVGGSEYVTKRIADDLVKDHEVFIFTRRLPGRKCSSYEPLRVVEYSGQSMPDFQGKLKKVNPDVILIYSDMFDFFRQVGLSSMGIKARLLVAPCGANWLSQKKQNSLLFYRNAHRIQNIICHSVYDRDYHLCDNPKLRDKTVIIPNGVDLSDFRIQANKEDLAAKHHLDASRPWVLNVSNFFPGKGQEHVFPILEKTDVNSVYIQVSHDIKFTNIGEMLEIKWRKSAKRFSESGRQVALLKNIPRQDIIDFLSASNLFLYTTEKEVAPIVMLEVMASKLPWICADVGNVEELRGGHCINLPKKSDYHAIFTTHGIEQFARSVPDLISKPTVGEEGYHQVRNRFNWDAILPYYRSIIEK